MEILRAALCPFLLSLDIQPLPIPGPGSDESGPGRSLGVGGNPHPFGQQAARNAGLAALSMDLAELYGLVVGW